MAYCRHSFSVWNLCCRLNIRRTNKDLAVMANRKCTLKTCRSELPSKKDSDCWQEKGYCNVECMSLHGLEKGRQAIERKRKADELGIKKRNTEFKKQFQKTDKKYRTEQIELTQRAFNKVIKLEELWRCAIDGGQPCCISCSKPWTPFDNADYAAGHWHSRGARSDLGMNNLNVYLQCNKRCNSIMSANKTGDMGTHGYNKGLVMRLGQEGFDRLDKKLAKVKLLPSWTIEDYETLRKWLNARARYLTKELELFNDINQK